MKPGNRWAGAADYRRGAGYCRRSPKAEANVSKGNSNVQEWKVMQVVDATEKSCRKTFLCRVLQLRHVTQIVLVDFCKRIPNTSEDDVFLAWE